MYNMLGLCDTIPLPDGEQWHLYDTEGDFAKLVHDRLGVVAEHLFLEILDEKQTFRNDEDYEQGYEQGYEDAEFELGRDQKDVEDIKDAVAEVNERLTKLLDSKYPINKLQVRAIAEQLHSVEERLKSL